MLHVERKPRNGNLVETKNEDYNELCEQWMDRENNLEKIQSKKSKKQQ